MKYIISIHERVQETGKSCQFIIYEMIEGSTLNVCFHLESLSLFQA